MLQILDSTPELNLHLKLLFYKEKNTLSILLWKIHYQTFKSISPNTSLLQSECTRDLSLPTFRKQWTLNFLSHEG